MKKIVSTISFCLAFCLALPLYAQDIDSYSSLIQERYAEVESFQADFKQELTHLESGTLETRKGVFLYKTPFLVRWESEPPYPELLLVTETEIWNYFSDEYLAYRYNLSILEENYSVFSVLTGQSRLDSIFNVSFISEENGIVQLKLVPKDQSVSMLEGFIWFEAETGIIRELEVIDFYRNSNKVALDAVVWNPPIPEDSFTFMPHTDVEVEDHFDAGY